MQEEFHIDLLTTRNFLILLLLKDDYTEEPYEMVLNKIVYNETENRFDGFESPLLFHIQEENEESPLNSYPSVIS